MAEREKQLIKNAIVESIGVLTTRRHEARIANDMDLYKRLEGMIYEYYTVLDKLNNNYFA